MKFFNLILVVFLYSYIAAQEGFNIVYTNPYFEDGIAAGIAYGHVIHEGHVYVMTETYDADEIIKAYWLKYDLEGNILDSAWVNETVVNAGTDISRFGNIVHRPEGIVFTLLDFCASSSCSNMDRDSLIMVDWNGEVVWKKSLEVDTTGYQIERYSGVCAYEDGYLAYGYIADTIGPWSFDEIKGLLTRLDAQGNILWNKRYEDVFEIRHCRVDQDGNIFLAGYFDDLFPNSFESLLMKVSSEGELIWRYEFGHNPGDEINDGELAPAIEIQENSTLLILSRDTGKEGFDNINGPLWAQKLIDNGNSYQVVDEQYINYIDVRNQVFNSVLTSNGNMAAIGTGGRYVYPPEVDSTQWPNGAYFDTQGLFLMLSPELDSLWLRYYTHWDHAEYIIDPLEWLYDITELEDGGFVLSGDARWSPQQDPGPLHHIWLMRVDSLGCLEPGCHLVSGLQEQVIGLQGSMKVFPNPWSPSSPLQIQISPSGTGPMPYQREATRLVLYDIQGRLLHEQSLSPIPNPSTGSGTYLVELDIPDLGTGQYVLHWMNERGAWYDSVKLMVE